MSTEVSVRKPLGAIDPNCSPRAATPKKGSRLERNETPKKIVVAAAAETQTPVRKASAQEVTPRKQKANPVPVAKAIVKETPKPYHSPTDDLISPVTRTVNARFHRGPIRQSARRVSKATGK